MPFMDREARARLDFSTGFFQESNIAEEQCGVVSDVSTAGVRRGVLYSTH